MKIATLESKVADLESQKITVNTYKNPSAKKSPEVTCKDDEVLLTCENRMANTNTNLRLTAVSSGRKCTCKSVLMTFGSIEVCFFSFFFVCSLFFWMGCLRF